MNTKESLIFFQDNHVFTNFIMAKLNCKQHSWLCNTRNSYAATLFKHAKHMQARSICANKPTPTCLHAALSIWYYKKQY